MGVLSYKIEGLDKTLRAINAGNKKIEQVLQDEINGWADMCATEAKMRAPTDLGQLKGAINPRYGRLEASVTVAVFYAAYVEFGTGQFAGPRVSQLPADWKEYAAQFKGTKKVKGMRAQPYLFPAYEKTVEQLEKDLKSIL